MKIKRGFIEVSEWGFPLTPEMFIGLKYIEVDLSKTIDSIEAFQLVGTNLLTSLPVVVDEYYFLNHLRFCSADSVTATYFTMQLVSSNNVSMYSPLVALTSADAERYLRNYEIGHVFIRGFISSSDFDVFSMFGIKINTS